MATSFLFNGIDITYNSTVRTVLPHVLDWSDRYNFKESKERGEYFDVQLNHEDFAIKLYIIFHESIGYEINPYVSRGSVCLKTLHQAVRLKAKKEIVGNNEIYLTQLKIAKLKKAEPPRRQGISLRKRSSIFGTPLHSKLYNSSIQEVSSISNFNIKQLLLENFNAIDIGTKEMITGDLGKNRKCEFVSFERGNFKLIIIVFILTRIYPILKEIFADE